MLDDLRELKPTLLAGLPGAFRLLHRKYAAIHRQWSAPCRPLVQKPHKKGPAARRQSRAPCYASLGVQAAPWPRGLART